jgi:hypothetical protein
MSTPGHYQISKAVSNIVLVHHDVGGIITGVLF